MFSNQLAETKQSNVKIDVYLLGNRASCLCCQHVTALITDFESKKKLAIDYTNFKKIQKVVSLNKKTNLETDLEKLNGSFAQVTLYSEKNFKEFVELFLKSKFSHIINFNCVSNNCADSVKFALDHFFPQSESEVSCFYKTLCCLGCIITLGSKCFSTIFFSIPNEVYHQALALKEKYGKNPNSNSNNSSATVTSQKDSCALNMHSLYAAPEKNAFYDEANQELLSGVKKSI